MCAHAYAHGGGFVINAPWGEAYRVLPKPIPLESILAGNSYSHMHAYICSCVHDVDYGEPPADSPVFSFTYIQPRFVDSPHVHGRGSGPSRYVGPLVNHGADIDDDSPPVDGFLCSDGGCPIYMHMWFEKATFPSAAHSCARALWSRGALGLRASPVELHAYGDRSCMRSC